MKRKGSLFKKYNAKIKSVSRCLINIFPGVTSWEPHSFSIMKKSSRKHRKWISVILILHSICMTFSSFAYLDYSITTFEKSTLSWFLNDSSVTEIEILKLLYSVMSAMSGFHVFTILTIQKRIFLFARKFTAGKYNYYVNIYASNLNGWTTFLYSYSLINPLSQHQHHSPFLNRHWITVWLLNNECFEFILKLPRFKYITFNVYENVNIEL